MLVCFLCGECALLQAITFIFYLFHVMEAASVLCQPLADENSKETPPCHVLQRIREAVSPIPLAMST